jgi:signal transduction histidine kinase/DNA-binding NarL/FixJ family response regulator
LEKIRLLLVDNDSTFYTAASLMLAHSTPPFRLDWVRFDTIGRKAIRRDRHDVYLLNYVPGKNGSLEIIKEAIKRGITAPIIILDSCEEPGADIRALQAGAADYLRKDRITPDAFKHAIRFAHERAKFSESILKSEDREKHIEQLTILQQIDAELSQILNIDNVLALALDATVRLSGANAGFIGLMNNGRVEIAQALGHYSSFPEHHLVDTPLIRKLVNEQQARLIQDVDKDPDHVTINPDARAQMLLPMVSYERLIGVLNLETNRTERFSEETFDFLKLITARVAVSIENAQLYKISQDQLSQLQELYAQVSELERLKSDMIRIASHDLRNPVGVILGYAQMLQQQLDGKISDQQMNFLQMIERASYRMEKITADILSLERIENMQSGVSDVVKLGGLVQELYEEFEPQAAAKKQPFRIKIDAGEFNIHADVGQIREAIANIISNAIKYTPDGGAININLKRSDGAAIFKVKDTGYGIPESEQIKLFQPFFRAYSDETADIEGTGLGLYLIKSICERFGGEIIFESVYGKGSTFGFQVPLATIAKSTPKETQKESHMAGAG